MAPKKKGKKVDVDDHNRAIALETAQSTKHKSCKTSPELQAIIGVSTDTRMGVYKKLWAYVRENRRQWQEDKRYFYPDKAMEPIFGLGRIPCNRMMRYITKQHLEPIPVPQLAQNKRRKKGHARDLY